MLESLIQYEVWIDRLALHLANGRELVFPEALSNGRANYIIFENLVRELAGLEKATGSDHKDSNGRTYEQKAYKDPELFHNDPDLFRISSSSTFGANNHGPTVNRLVRAGDYEGAFKIVNETGYSKNDFYILTNTGGYSPKIPVRFVIVPTQIILKNLDSTDPRLISKRRVFDITKSKVRLA